MQIELSETRDIVVARRKVKQINVICVIDNLQKKTIRAVIKQFGKRPVLLWKDDGYREWTMADVRARIVELFDK